MCQNSEVPVILVHLHYLPVFHFHSWTTSERWMNDKWTTNERLLNTDDSAQKLKIYQEWQSCRIWKNLEIRGCPILFSKSLCSRLHIQSSFTRFRIARCPTQNLSDRRLLVAGSLNRKCLICSRLSDSISVHQSFFTVICLRIWEMDYPSTYVTVLGIESVSFLNTNLANLVVNKAETL